MELERIETPLFDASGRGHAEVVELLLAKGADPNKANKDGETPLFDASGQGHVEVVELLLAKGADPNKEDKDGWTPLFWACRYPHVEVVELLLKAGADVNQLDNLERTPLTILDEDCTEIAELLKEAGAVNPVYVTLTHESGFVFRGAIRNKSDIEDVFKRAKKAEQSVKK